MTETVGARSRAQMVVAAAAVLTANGCKKAAPPPAPPPAEVAVVEVQPQRVPVSSEFTGEVQAYRRVEVRPRVEGSLSRARSPRAPWLSRVRCSTASIRCGPVLPIKAPWPAR